MVNPNNTVNYDPSDESNYVSQNQDVKPVTAPQPTNKDFKKVLGKTGKEGKEGKAGATGKKKTTVKMFDEEVETFAEVSEKSSKDDEENASEEVPAAPVSLFDLSKGKPVKEEPVAKPAVKSTAPVHAKVESPSDLFKRMATKEPVKPFKAATGEQQPVVAHSDVASVKQQEPKKDKFTTRYTPEQTDLAYVNPLAANSATQPITNIISDTKAVERTSALSPSMQELVDHIVKTMYTVETKGQTDTIITLQYPPLFKDANIVITAYDSARGQFNLSFENLTQSAKRILDQEDNRKALVAALEHKGYGVQIFQTTTLIEHPVPTDHSESSRGSGRDQSREDDQSGGQKRRNREE